jgi:uncharacterized membrane protein
VVGKYQLLGDLEGSFGSNPSASGSSAAASSSNGSVVVGQAPQGSNTFGAFRWTSAHGMVPLPPSMLYASAVTADGSMTVGGDAG